MMELDKCWQNFVNMLVDCIIDRMHATFCMPLAHFNYFAYVMFLLLYYKFVIPILLCTVIV